MLVQKGNEVGKDIPVAGLADEHILMAVSLKQAEFDPGLRVIVLQVLIGHLVRVEENIIITAGDKQDGGEVGLAGCATLLSFRRRSVREAKRELALG